MLPVGVLIAEISTSQKRWRATALQKRLQRSLALDAGAGVGAEAVAAAHLAFRQRAASLRGLRRGAVAATAGDCDRWCAEGYGARWQRADVLRERAPVERLIAELFVEIARRAEKIDAWRAEGGRDVRLREVKESRPRVGRIGDGDVEPAVRGLHGDGSDRRRRRRWHARIHAGALA